MHNKATIQSITSKIIQDSRGKPTISVTVSSQNESASFDVPSGASTGAREVSIKNPHDVSDIIQDIILPRLLNVSVHSQKAIDDALHELGETHALDSIGGNTALGISVAASKLAAIEQGQETWEYIRDLFGSKTQASNPRLFVNLINGGAHATVGSDIQEHQIIPDTDNIEIALETTTKIQNNLATILHSNYLESDIGIGDEGGYMIPSTSTIEPFELLMDAIAHSAPEIKVFLGIDAAANSFYENGSYNLNGSKLTKEQLLKTYQQLRRDFPNFQMIEDPFSEDDLTAFSEFRDSCPNTLTIGDDLTTTSKASLAQAIQANAINGIIIKPNQIGTVSRTLETMKLAYEHNVKCIVSHRSGETMDSFIADLAYGTKCYGLKAGAPSMQERAVKYKRLIEIAD